MSYEEVGTVQGGQIFCCSEGILILLEQPWWNFWCFLPNVVDTELSQSSSSGVSARKVQSDV